jgi:hypothetical protein
MSFNMTTRIFILLSISFAIMLSAAESPANSIAATIILERAREAELHGQPLIAQQLRSLAQSLSAGTVTLQDATLVVHMALAGANSGPLPTPARQPPISAAQVTAILDGETLAPTPPEPVLASEPVIIPPTEKVEITPAALTIPIATTVLTASRVGEAKTMLVMIGAGEDQKVSLGQRFIIKRGEQQIAVVSATQVKAAMSICIAIAGTIADNADISSGDSVFSE